MLVNKLLNRLCRADSRNRMPFNPSHGYSINPLQSMFLLCTYVNAI